VFESKNDYDIMHMLARKLGFAEQMFKNIKAKMVRCPQRTFCARSTAAAGPPVIAANRRSVSKRT